MRALDSTADQRQLLPEFSCQLGLSLDCPRTSFLRLSVERHMHDWSRVTGNLGLFDMHSIAFEAPGDGITGSLPQYPLCAKLDTSGFLCSRGDDCSMFHSDELKQPSICRRGFQQQRLWSCWNSIRDSPIGLLNGNLSVTFERTGFLPSRC